MKNDEDNDFTLAKSLSKGSYFGELALLNN